MRTSSFLFPGILSLAVLLAEEALAEEACGEGSFGLGIGINGIQLGRSFSVGLSFTRRSHRVYDWAGDSESALHGAIWLRLGAERTPEP